MLELNLWIMRDVIFILNSPFERDHTLYERTAYEAVQIGAWQRVNCHSGRS